MKKRVLSVITVLLMLLISVLPSFAVSSNSCVYDYYDLLSDTAETVLNEEAAKLESACNVRFIFALREDATDINALTDEVFNANYDGSVSTVVLAINEDYYNIYASEDIADTFTDEVEDDLWNAYAGADTYYDGVHNVIAYLGTVFSSGDSTGSGEALFGTPSRLVDDQDLLTDTEEQTVLNALDTASQNTQLDIVVLTTDELNEVDDREFCDDYFDYNGYGTGTDRSGILLAFDANDGLWYISTRGKAISVFTDTGTDYLFDAIRQNLRDCDYVTAFTSFAGYCQSYVESYNSTGSAEYEGIVYSDAELYMQRLPQYLVISLGLGILLAFIIVKKFKNELKSVHMNSGAANYEKSNSMHITENRDMFLYSQVTSRPKPKESSGSSSHSSSSGASHGGHGGRL